LREPEGKMGDREQGQSQNQGCDLPPPSMARVARIKAV
jgi:hypothetical protein